MKPDPASRARPRPNRRRGMASARGFARLSVESVIATLRQTAGLRTAAAHRLGVGRSTLYEFMQAHPEIEAALVEIENEMTDRAEAALFRAIRDGNVNAIIFYLSTQGKDRGWTRRVEATGAEGGPFIVQPAPQPTPGAMLAVLERLAAERRQREASPPVVVFARSLE